MKIVVLGKGLAGCFTALHYKYFSPYVEVELIHDSDIPTQIVGQGTLPDVPTMLWNTLEMNWYDNPIKATIKTGILYDGWGEKTDKWFHPFHLDSAAMHYDPHALQNHILAKGGFKVTDRNINSYNEIDADYIFDCRGFPPRYDDYELLTNPIDSVVLGRGPMSNIQWTQAIATPDGWCFVIPTLEQTSYGYLYNSTLTSRVDAYENFKNIINPDEIFHDFSFKNYIAENPVIDERIILNGNRLFFLEPLEATALSVYIYWIRHTYDWIILKNTHPEKISFIIKELIHEVENFILYHYLHGSKYNTSFWEATKVLKIRDPKFWERMNDALSTKDPLTKENSKDYGIWELISFKQMYDGLQTHDLNT